MANVYLEVMVHEPQVFSSSGAMAVGLLAFFAEEWYNFQGMCAIALFLLCIVAFFVPESPRWGCTLQRNFIWGLSYVTYTGYQNENQIFPLVGSRHTDVIYGSTLAFQAELTLQLVLK